MAVFASAAVHVHAEEPEAKPADAERWAVILVGLPGDDEHSELFAETADQWQKWLTDSLQIPQQQVLRLPALEKRAAPLTAESVRLKLDELSKKLQPNDSLWIFTLGHGHYDGRRAWWHVAGRDPSDEDFGRWLSGIQCREQVIWLTQSSSGWFVKPLSRPGRIVIAATAADDESNETEFPHALATVMQVPLAKLDTNKDQQVSVAELFTEVLKEVGRRFEQDKRLPTEHAQLDDNGDGRGSEEIVEKQPPTPKADGELARKTLLPYRPKSADATTDVPVKKAN